MNLLDRITINPNICGGQPCIRGMRIRLSDVLDLLANGLTPQEIVEELPDLELEDIRASLHLPTKLYPAKTPVRSDNRL